VESGKTMDSAIIKGKSGIATLGGDHPQDLLVKPSGKLDLNRVNGFLPTCF
jgi:hypothetical protein